MPFLEKRDFDHVTTSPDAPRASKTPEPFQKPVLKQEAPIIKPAKSHTEDPFKGEYTFDFKNRLHTPRGREELAKALGTSDPKAIQEGIVYMEEEAKKMGSRIEPYKIEKLKINRPWQKAHMQKETAKGGITRAEEKGAIKEETRWKAFIGMFKSNKDKK